MKKAFSPLCAFLLFTFMTSALVSGDWTYTLEGDEATITGYTGSGENVVIPETLDGCVVKTIGNYVFYDCSSLTSITIPDGVTSIGNYAFDGCSNLTSINIPDSVTSIGGRAFRRCNSLTNITLGNGVKNLNSFAFSTHSALTSVTIGNGVTSIENYTFKGCSSLTNITLGNSVTSIGISAFDGCSNLTSITIPDGVTSIGNNAFWGCSKLVLVIFKGNAPIMNGVNIFYNSTLTVYYLPNTTGWSSTFLGRSTALFTPVTESSYYEPGAGFEFTWVGTYNVPMNVEWAPSPSGAWTVVSANNATGHFVDDNPPTGKAFYRAVLP